jgi:ADP-ribosylglycohydrolase
MNDGALQDRIMGMFYLSAIGDAWGVQAKDSKSEKPSGFLSSLFSSHTDQITSNDFASGQGTVHTQLFLAIARSLTNKNAVDPVDMYREHVSAMDRSSVGWDDGMVQSLKSVLGKENRFVLAEAGDTSRTDTGIAVKVAPIGAFLCAEILRVNALSDEARCDKTERILREVRKQTQILSCMTHRTKMAVASGYAQVSAICDCLLEGINIIPNVKALRKAFLESIIGAARNGEEADIDDGMSIKLSDIFRRLLIGSFQGMEPKTLLELTGGAAGDISNSLPFVYAMFLRKPDSIETLYEVIGLGGDVASNAAMTGALLGAFNGTDIIPSGLLDRLTNRKEVETLASQFCDSLGV